jgi:starch synthase
MHIVMVAAENGTLLGAKVGGIADVIRDVPRALARLGYQVTVLTPGYQALSLLPGARLLQTMTVEFASTLEPLSLFQVGTPQEPSGVRHLVLENPLFAACGAGRIYCHDTAEPFATDAAKFALFCQGVCHALVTGAVPQADILHLHDWHAALVLLLRQAHGGYHALQTIPAVYTIHNLSLQGVRPFTGSWSSPAQWFPTLKYSTTTIADPAVPHCINLMRTGINLADRVHVVSPTYAREILQPSVPADGLIRGEGLEADLREVAAAGRLHGILNGCEYPPVAATAGKKPAKGKFIEAANAALAGWVGGRQQIEAAHFHSQQRLLQWAQRKTKDQCVVGSVGRLTPQKVALLQVATGPDTFAIDDLLRQLDKGMLVLLGSGDAACERFMLAAMQRHPNFLFLCGYSETLGELLYHFCDLFLMPSSFEPCGISQMLAMRAGTPCLVHQVGGLADTVQHMVNGFGFAGANQIQQVNNMLTVFGEALQLQTNKLPVWQALCRNAAAARFSWDDTVRDYKGLLYQQR